MLLLLPPYKLNILLNILISKYLKDFTCIHIFSDSDDILFIPNKPTVYYSTNFTNSVLCEAIVLQTDYPLSMLQTIERKIKREVIMKYFNRHYIIFPNIGFQEDVFQSKYMQQIFNILVLDRYSNDSIKLFTYALNIKAKVELDQWDVVTENFGKHSFLFPNKLRSGLTFKLGASSVKPYVDLETSSGIEYFIVREYCNIYHLTMQVFNAGDLKWGKYFANFTGIGLYGGLLNGSLQAAIGGYYFQGDKFYYVDYVVPTTRIGNTCLVPSPKSHVDIYTLVLNFKELVWVIIVLTYFIYIIIWKYGNNLHYEQTSIELKDYKTRELSFNLTFINVIGIAVQQPVPIVTHDKNMGTRNIIIPLVLFSLVISAAYSSQQYNILMKPRFTNAINTVDELEESGILWGADDETYASSIKLCRPNLHKKYIVDSNENLMRRLFKMNFGLLTEKFDSGIIPKSPKPQRGLKAYKRISVMSQDLFWVYSIILLQKNSPFQPSLYLHLLHTRETGLVIHWERMQFSPEAHKFLLALKHISKGRKKQLSMLHVGGTFVLLGMGLLLSTLCFIIEITYKRYNM